MPDRSLVAALEAVLPRRCALSVWEGGDDPGLFPIEAGAVERAVPSRRLEFARGRACARRALAAVGGAAGPIPVGPSREPVWPEGFVGAITHCDGMVAAVAARREDVSAIGLDGEVARPLRDEVRRLVVHPAEAIGELGPLAGTLLFSAKESIHKAVFPLEGVWLDFLDVRVELDRGGGLYRAMPAPDAKASSRSLDDLVGRFVVGERHLVTLCYLSGTAGPSSPLTSS